MAQIKLTYDKEITALLVVDPYNDFISQGGKIWDRIRGVAEGNDCVPHMGEREIPGGQIRGSTCGLG